MWKHAGFLMLVFVPLFRTIVTSGRRLRRNTRRRIPQSGNRFRLRFMVVSCVRASGRGAAVWVCERGVFVNAGRHNDEIVSRARLCSRRCCCYLYISIIRIVAICVFLLLVVCVLCYAHSFLIVLTDKPPFVVIYCFVVFLMVFALFRLILSAGRPPLVAICVVFFFEFSYNLLLYVRVYVCFLRVLCSLHGFRSGLADTSRH